jgi:hypothetical protein
MVTRRMFLVGGAAAAGAGALGACSPPTTGPGGPPPGCAPPSIGPLPAPGSIGLIDEAVWQARATDYLRFATTSLQPGSPVSIALHQLRALREPDFDWDPSPVTVDALEGVWTQLDTWADTGDFTLMYLHWVRALDLRSGAAGRPRLDSAVVDAIERRMREFRYRYDDPLPADGLDHKWFWSENHRIIFAVDELLSGLALPDATFTVTGLTGAEHAARARPTILRWIRERGRYGFSEWHSNVYLSHDINPLLTVLELGPADDLELQRAAAGAIDLCLVDLAAHLHRGVFGATRGRTYEKDKMTARDESTFTVANLLFDDTTLADGTPVGYVSRTDAGCLGFIATDRYRLPEVVRRMAVSDEVGSVVERHGLPLDPTAPVTPWPEPVDGHGFDESELEFWWSQGAMTSWQLVPTTLAVADRYRLWDTDLFRAYRPLRSLSSQPALTQLFARELAPITAAGLLGEPHTVTWRSPEVMLSTVVDHRAGHAMQQSHAWQATCDADAIVFTTHPTGAPGTEGLGQDSGYWTGTASMPRSAQHERVAIHCYWPAYEPLDLGPLGFTIDYEPYTHAFFPQERFDAVVQEGGWTIGRRGGGFVALWSARPTEWRTTPVISRGGTTFEQPFDLVAPGDPRNVWICEVARAVDWGPTAEAAFDVFVGAVVGAPVSATIDGGAWDVSFESPSAGVLQFGTRSPFTVDGEVVPLRGGPRHRSRWGEVCHLQESLELVDPDSGHRLAVDFATGARETS